jgi:hypothetical protein
LKTIQDKWEDIGVHARDKATTRTPGYLALFDAGSLLVNWLLVLLLVAF